MWRFINGGGWVLVLVAVCGAWTWREINAAAYRGEVRARAEQTELAAEAFMDSVDGAWAVRKAAWDSAQAVLADELAAQKGVARVAEANASRAILGARSTIDGLRDSLRVVTLEDLVAVEAGIDSLVVAGAACNAALGTCEELGDTLQARIWEVEHQLAQSLVLNERQGVTIGELQDVRPPTMTRAGWVGWAVAVGAVIVTVVR